MENQTDKKYVNDKLVPSAHLHYGDFSEIAYGCLPVVYQIQTVNTFPLINTSPTSTKVMNPPNFCSTMGTKGLRRYCYILPVRAQNS